MTEGFYCRRVRLCELCEFDAINLDVPPLSSQPLLSSQST